MFPHQAMQDRLLRPPPLVMDRARRRGAQHGVALQSHPRGNARTTIARHRDLASAAKGEPKSTTGTAASVAMYRARRTCALPPQIMRLPRSLPESRLNGATPTRAAIWRPSSIPSSGSSDRWALGVGSVIMNQSAVRPCLLKRSRGAQGAARLYCGVGAFSAGVRLASSKLVLFHKAGVFGEGRGFRAPSLRSASARCEQLRPRLSGDAVTALGESFMEAQPLVLRRPSSHRALSFSRSPRPNPALNRTRRQQASFVSVVLRSPCRLAGRRAARRLAHRYAASEILGHVVA